MTTQIKELIAEAAGVAVAVALFWLWAVLVLSF